MPNAINDSPVASRIAAATSARTHRPDYTSEVRALLDAARRVISTTGKARVADIVAEADLRNDAFYRHFPSKDALVAAIMEEGTERLAAAVARRMERVPTAEQKVRCWLDAMIAQADPSLAEQTSAVLRTSTNLNTSIPTGDHVIRRPIARLLQSPFAALGCKNPELDAELVTHAILSHVSGHIRGASRPTVAETEHLYRFCIRSVSGEA
jgi:AcrR family transcriptional regulator